MKNLNLDFIYNKVKDNLGKIGCIMGSFEQDNENISDMFKKLAMHISAAKPLAFDKDGLDQQLVSKEESFRTTCYFRKT